MSHRLAGLLLAALLLLVLVPSALAAPVTVNVRVEGSAGTLFEGPVTTDAKDTVTTPTSPDPHPCNVAGNGAAPPGGGTAGTPTTALIDAAASAGLPFDATWTGTTVFGAVNDFFVSRVGADVNQSAAPFASWGVAVNFTPLQVGGCQLALGVGADVLWAYDFFNKTRLLALTGPATADVGTPITVTVRDGQNGAPVGGASVGGTTTDSSGTATFSFARAGVQRLKAEAPDSVRSNAVVVCVHAGNDGTCGTTAPPGAAAPVAAPAAPAGAPVVPGITGGVAGATAASADRAAPRSRLLAPRDGHRYRRGVFAPRALRAAVAESGSGILNVKLRLTRRVGARCSAYSGKRERFIGQRCGSGFFFKVGDAATVDYLLPEKLPRGRYVLDVKATDKAFNRDTVRQRGRNRVVFEVS